MSEGLTNEYLEKTSKKILKRKNFIGVFPADANPDVKQKTFSIIFNTGNYNSDGEHFVAIYITRNTIYYFDSFGMKASNKNILKFINKYQRKNFYFNSTQIQSKLSNFCGFYCLAFLIANYQKIPMIKFLKIFSPKKLLTNDKTVISFIMKFI